jgi:hypothetical protein
MVANEIVSSQGELGVWRRAGFVINPSLQGEHGSGWCGHTGQSSRAYQLESRVGGERERRGMDR